MKEKRVYCNAKNVERISTKSNLPYNVCVIEFYCRCGAKITIEDFNVKLPFELVGVPVTFDKNDYNRYIAKELDYAVPYQYNMGLKLLITHECDYYSINEN